MKKLTPAQQHLYGSMQLGVRVRFMSGISGYYFRDDTMKHCSPTVMALLKAGYLEKYDQKSYSNDHKIRLKERP